MFDRLRESVCTETSLFLTSGIDRHLLDLPESCILPFKSYLMTTADGRLRVEVWSSSSSSTSTSSSQADRYHGPMTTTYRTPPAEPEAFFTSEASDLDGARFRSGSSNMTTIFSDSGVGAACYVIVVIFVYGLSIVMLIGSVIRRKRHKASTDRQIVRYLHEFQIVRETSSRDEYRGLKREIINKLQTRRESRVTRRCSTSAAATVDAAAAPPSCSIVAPLPFADDGVVSSSAAAATATLRSDRPSSCSPSSGIPSSAFGHHLRPQDSVNHNYTTGRSVSCSAAGSPAPSNASDSDRQHLQQNVPAFQTTTNSMRGRSGSSEIIIRCQSPNGAVTFSESFNVVNDKAAIPFSDLQLRIELNRIGNEWSRQVYVVI